MDSLPSDVLQPHAFPRSSSSFDVITLEMSAWKKQFTGVMRELPWLRAPNDHVQVKILQAKISKTTPAAVLLRPENCSNTVDSCAYVVLSGTGRNRPYSHQEASQECPMVSNHGIRAPRTTQHQLNWTTRDQHFKSAHAESLTTSRRRPRQCHLSVLAE